MKLVQNKIRWLSRLMLGLVLFTQGVVAVYACATPDAGPVQAYVTGQEAQAVPPCHQQDSTDGNANVCLAHCTQSDQVSAGQVVQLAVPATTVSHIAITPAVQHIDQATYPEYVALNSGPPLSIRFCSFLI